MTSPVSPPVQVSSAPRARSVVVGVDTDGRSASAVVWAVDHAERDRALVTLISVREPGEVPREVAGRHDLGTLARRLSLTEVRQREVVGDPVAALLDEAALADLLVVGARTMRPAKRMVVGSTSRSVARWSPVPLVVVPEAWMQPSMATSPIVAAIRPGPPEAGDSDPATDADVLDFGFDSAAALKVPLIVVSAWDVAALYAWSPAEVERLRAEHQHELEARLTAWRQRHPGVEVVIRSTTEPASEAVVNASGIAQLVVVGRHHTPALSGLLGRTTNQVLTHSTRPVAIVPSGGRAELLSNLKARRDPGEQVWAPTF